MYLIVHEHSNVISVTFHALQLQETSESVTGSGFKSIQGSFVFCTMSSGFLY